MENTNTLQLTEEVSVKNLDNWYVIPFERMPTPEPEPVQAPEQNPAICRCALCRSREAQDALRRIREAFECASGGLLPQMRADFNSISDQLNVLENETMARFARECTPGRGGLVGRDLGLSDFGRFYEGASIGPAPEPQSSKLDPNLTVVILPAQWAPDARIEAAVEAVAEEVDLPF